MHCGEEKVRLNTQAISVAKHVRLWNYLGHSGLCVDDLKLQ